MTEETVTPQGEPLTEEQLAAIAVIRQRDLDKAIGTANGELKPYLNAVRRVRGDR